MPVIYTVDKKKIIVPEVCPFCKESTPKHKEDCPLVETYVDMNESDHLRSQPYND